MYLDVVFFGQGLPGRFHELQGADFRQCDLLIVAGTTLTVFPFAGLVNDVSQTTPRLLFNKDSVGVFRANNPATSSSKEIDLSQDADPLVNYRDVQHLGECDLGARTFCALLGWEGELNALMGK